MGRRISRIKAALGDFQAFPAAVREQVTMLLRIAARGEKADKANPMKGLGTGVFEMALAYRGNAYRAVYAVQIGEEVWVVHPFQEKSTQGIKDAAARNRPDPCPAETRTGDVAMKTWNL